MRPASTISSTGDVSSTSHLSISVSAHGVNTVAGYIFAKDVPEPRARLARYLWVMACAAAGCCARYYTGILAKDVLAIAGHGYTGQEGDGDLSQVLTYNLLANLLGSLCMGFLAALAPLLLPRCPAVYTGLASGFCGSYTTFSSWNNEVASIIARGQVARGLLAAAVGVGCSIGALRLGVGAGTELLRRMPRHKEPPVPRRFFHTNELRIAATVLAAQLVGFSVAFGAGFAADHPQRVYMYTKGKLLLGLCFAPFFAALRYKLSTYNSKSPMFPAFTLTANVVAALGTTLLAATSKSASLGAHELSTSPSTVGLSSDADLIMGALSLGAFGCLSTVSTFVNEVRLLPSAHAIRYAACTLFLGQLVAVPILVGFRELDAQL
jgi:fluoride ion exporter CrcB/FEX